MSPQISLKNYARATPAKFVRIKTSLVTSYLVRNRKSFVEIDELTLQNILCTYFCILYIKANMVSICNRPNRPALN